MKEVVLTEKEISDILDRLAGELDRDLANEEKPPVFLCVMKGAMPFYSDLIKRVKRNIVCDFVQLTSYCGGLASTGNIHLEKDIATNLDGKTVVIVEDIVDTGLSMKFLLEHINFRFQPKKVVVCALFDKEIARVNDVKVDYVGMTLHESKFLVGYGLDYREILRNVPYVYVPDKEEIASYDAMCLD